MCIYLRTPPPYIYIYNFSQIGGFIRLYALIFSKKLENIVLFFFFFFTYSCWAGSTRILKHAKITPKSQPRFWPIFGLSRLNPKQISVGLANCGTRGSTQKNWKKMVFGGLSVWALACCKWRAAAPLLLPRAPTAKISPYISNTISQESPNFQTNLHASKQSPWRAKDLSGKLIDLEIQIF